jgi:hypothetical protein
MCELKGHDHQRGYMLYAVVIYCASAILINAIDQSTIGCAQDMY